MKKRVLMILGAVLIVLLVVVLLFVFVGKRERTLEEITLGKYGGGRLRYEVNDYQIIEVCFVSNGKNADEREGVCCVTINYYKDASYSASGKVFDHYEENEYPCSFTDYSLTINGFDHYTYELENRNGREYVVFSKPFLGVTTWYVNK